MPYSFRAVSTSLAPDELFERIERSIDGLRPYIASHKGTVEVIDFDPAAGRLFVRMGGTCAGCSASSITLKHGIEQRLRAAVPEVLVVEAV
jgi:Fe-S cluster biogenesis protein NfuA